MYSILILRVQNKHSSNIYLEHLSNDNDIGRAAICMLPHLVVIHLKYQYLVTENWLRDKDDFNNILIMILLNIVF